MLLPVRSGSLFRSVFIVVYGVARFVLAPVPLLVQRRDVICDMMGMAGWTTSSLPGVVEASTILVAFPLLELWLTSLLISCALIDFPPLLMEWCEIPFHGRRLVISCQAADPPLYSLLVADDGWMLLP